MFQARGYAAGALAALLGAGLFVAAGVVGYAIGTSHGGGGSTTTTVSAAAAVDPHVAAGAHDFVSFACAQCHGMQGRGGVSPDVPGADGRRLAHRGAPADDHQPRPRRVGEPDAAPTCPSGAR